MTNRIKGLYAVTPDLADTRKLVAQVRTVLEAGASLLQYRNKPASDMLRHEQALALLAECRQFGVPLIINDHVDLAYAIGADGVHLGGDDGEIAVARTVLGADKIIGASCYNRIELALRAKSQGADYVAFGACFSSGTKPLAVRAPLALFAQARAEVGLPTVAIGGITAENLPAVLEAGADCVAMVGAVFGEAPDLSGRVASIVRTLRMCA